MKQFLEFLPLIGLALGYIIAKIIAPDAIAFYAAGAVIIATLAQFALYKQQKMRIPTMQLVTGLLFIGFGVLTLIFRNEMFIYIKPTVVTWLFAVGFYLLPKLERFGYRTPMELLLGEQFDLPKKRWHQLNISWVIFHFLSGLANLIIAYQIYQQAWSEDVWYYFKLFGLLVATFVFVAAQFAFILKYGKQIAVNDTENSNETNNG